MTPLLALALAQAAPTAPPADWSGLPVIYLNRASGVSYTDTVAIMQLARRRDCRASIGPMPAPAEAPNTRMEGVSVEMIVLVATDGRILNILAAPGACDPIRNYARALVNRHYRGRIRPPAGPGPAWYRTSLGFKWEP